MKASAFEFRIRYLLHAIVFGLGFWAPWNYLLPANPIGANAHLWGLLAADMGKSGLMNFTAAFDLLLVLAILLALAAAALRTWASAYLGAGIVESGKMHADAGPTGLSVDGPYRRLRNPLYLGVLLHAVALTPFMSWSGALFTVLLIPILEVRLILGEEAFLSQKLGPVYTAYAAKVPRLLPALRPRVPAAGQVPRWGQAFLGEIYFWAVALSFAFAGWRYDAGLLVQCVLVAFGLSLVTRALTTARPQTPAPTAT